jgi:hypothetical protein
VDDLTPTGFSGVIVTWDVMCGRPQERKVFLDVRRSVECSHVFGLLMQLALLALMKSADQLPNHVNALEAL